MTTRLLILFFFALFFLQCAAQQNPSTGDASTGRPADGEGSFRYVRTFPGLAADFTVDNLGNIYILSPGGQLKKLLPNGDSAAVFNNVRKFGKVFSFDVSNPQKIILYYKDFGTIVALDRLLNNRSTLDLRTHNLLQVKAVGRAYDNNIWIFDEMEGKLKRISDEGRIIDQSADFRMLFDTMPSPSYIIDQDQRVYLYDPAAGAYIFDYYGGFQSRIPFIGWTDFNVIDKTLFGRDDKYLYRYEPSGLRLQQYAIPEFMKQAQKIMIAPNFIYLLQDGLVRTYAYR